jgi:micrococcal nuclease
MIERIAVFVSVVVVVIALIFSVISNNPNETMCFGIAKCFKGTVTKIRDGDTIELYVDETKNHEVIRLALVSSPELTEVGGREAKEFTEMLCPVGTKVLIDEDDKQTGGSFGRIVGLVYCGEHAEKMLNIELIESGNGQIEKRFCSKSEFQNKIWVRLNGC